MAAGAGACAATLEAGVQNAHVHVEMLLVLGDLRYATPQTIFGRFTSHSAGLNRPSRFEVLCWATVNGFPDMRAAKGVPVHGGGGLTVNA